VLVRLAIAAILCAFSSSIALAAAAPSVPSAFSRPAVATDRLPSTFPGAPNVSGTQAYDSRRIATYQDTKRRWRLYIFKQVLRGRENICLYVFQGLGGGGGCSPTSSFFAPGRQVAASRSGRELAGVASDEVARVFVIGPRGVVHRVALTSDQGFIFTCRAYNGCWCVVSRLQAFDGQGKLITNQRWGVAPGRNCRRR
jgi:hypothetical protein